MTPILEKTTALRSPGRSVGRIVPGALAVMLAVSGLAWGQSELPPRRQGTLRVTYQDMSLGDQLFSEDVITGQGNLGDKVDEGTTKIRALVLAADYGLSSRLAVSGSATYVQTQYDGPIPHGGYDDGSTNGTLQDASLVVLYKALNAPIAIIPFAGVVVPMRDYETRGLAAAGRGLNQTILGVNLGWQTPGVPLWVDVTYAYRFVEELDGVNTDRRNLGLRIGYRFNERLSGSMFGSRRSSPGGYDLITDASEPNFMPVHDAAIALSETSGGAGLTWTINPAVDLYGTYATTLSGENLQESRQVSVGVAWRFGNNPVLGGR